MTKRQPKRRKLPELDTEEKEWLKEISVWIADVRLDYEDLDCQMKNHHDAIALHRKHVKLLRMQQRLVQKRLIRGERMLAKWKTKKGLPA